MKRIWIREAFESDIPNVADNIRAEDLLEINSSHHGMTQMEVLTKSFRQSRIYRKVVHEEGYGAIAMFGLASCPIDFRACVWFLGTDRMGLHRKWFMRQSKPVIQEMLEKRSFLYNMVDSRYEMSVRWLQWCGFTIQRDAVVFNGIPFHSLTMECDKNDDYECEQDSLFGLDAVGYPLALDPMPCCVHLFEHENSKVRREPANHSREGSNKRK